ncbi:MAG: N-acetylmuramic acid 6-phosphate etherase [Verrucomicrobia bacterium]|nr:N-acetylmuramic acid 6-phosphate etherase [Verrucomicrobiota bacterium]
MKRLIHPALAPNVLGLEAGGTRTVALLAGPDNTCHRRVETGPANLRLLDDPALRRHFRHLARQFPRPAALGIGMAGAREDSDRRRIREAAAAAWPGVPCWVGNDLDTAFAAAGTWPADSQVGRVIMISGTGSCCYGCNRAGHAVKVGGWGHLLGDRGSGYDIALRALQTVLQVADRDGRWPALGQRLLRALALNEPNDLVTWVHAAPKGDVAALAVEVFAAYAERDRLAGDVLAGAAQSLTEDALACAARLAHAPEPVEFVFTGSTLLKQPGFAQRVGRSLRRGWPGASVRALDREGVWGAVALAQAELKRVAPPTTAGALPVRRRAPASWSPAGTDDLGDEEAIPCRSRPRPRPRSSETLGRCTWTGCLWGTPSGSCSMRMRNCRRPCWLSSSRSSGPSGWWPPRCAGAAVSGTSGPARAVAWACWTPASVRPRSACRRTGCRRFWRGGRQPCGTPSRERRTMRGREPAPSRFGACARGDVVLGIAASGRTPFVWGALHAARRLGARTVLLCFNPNLRFPRGTRPDVVVAPEVGPEVLTGSTRLKAGTATKLVLNLLTTLAMVRLGKVVGNLMVDVRASNAKLRDRAVRIVQTLTGRSPAEAQAALEASGWEVRRALRFQP